MKNPLPLFTMLAILTSSASFASYKVNDEASFKDAITAANDNSSINKIVFQRNATITLTAPIVYDGAQPLVLIGNGAIIDGSEAGSFILDEDLTAVTQDATLVFNTAADLKIIGLTIENSATRGIAINLPIDAVGRDISINLFDVNILDSALFGLHIDDNLDELDDGDIGSDIGIILKVASSSFVGNGTGATDFDGIRVDERGNGGIKALFFDTQIEGNGGDGIELDEGGAGSVNATFSYVSINGNGFLDEDDLDDGLDIDETGEGDLKLFLFKAQVNNNSDEGLDLDEEGDGDVVLKLFFTDLLSNIDEGVKVGEEDGGDIKANFFNVEINDNGDDGLQFTEIDGGAIRASLVNVTANNNDKYGIKMEQFFVEDEDVPVEEAGLLRLQNLSLSGNDKGDEVDQYNILIENLGDSSLIP